MNNKQQFVVTLEQLNQMATSIDALGKQIGVMATAPLLAQLTGLTRKPPLATGTDDGEKASPAPIPTGDNGEPRPAV